MNKIIKVLKRICLMLLAFFMSMYTKVMAATILLNDVLNSADYNVQPAYGVVQPEPKITIILEIIKKTLIIPIAFVTGIIIYFKKSSSNMGKKILMTIITLIILVLIEMGINYVIINEL